MDAIQLLTADHDEVRGLFEQFRQAHEAEDMDRMKELQKQIFSELETHTRIEEDIFYPAVRETDEEELAESVDEGVQEHHVVKVLMREIEEVSGEDTFVAKMKVLMENVEHHAEEEESEMFPALRSNLGADVLDALAEELEAGKKRRGAPVLADKIDLTKEQLIELAREQEIPGRSAMDHEELAATVAPTS
jgi:hemerythrin superfamily protein